MPLMLPMMMRAHQLLSAALWMRSGKFDSGAALTLRRPAKLTSKPGCAAPPGRRGCCAAVSRRLKTVARMRGSRPMRCPPCPMMPVADQVHIRRCHIIGHDHGVSYQLAKQAVVVQICMLTSCLCYGNSWCVHVLSCCCQKITTYGHIVHQLTTMKGAPSVPAV